MKQANAEPVKQTKASAQILEAAIELFAAYGYFGTTIRHIAKKAKVTPMTVYRLFKNKPSLFGMALRTVIARSVNQAQFLKTVFDHKDNGNVRSFVTAAVRHWYDSVPEQPARLMMYAYLSRNEEWQATAYAPLEDIIKVLASTLDEGIDKKAKPRPKVAVAARTLILGLFQFKITHPKMRSAREERAAVEDILDQWWMGVIPESE
jgi:AcrR family transcriptional regulator